MEAELSQTDLFLSGAEQWGKKKENLWLHAVFHSRDRFYLWLW